MTFSDTFSDAVDNCLTLANADQLDRDKDGRGDRCDELVDVAASSPYYPYVRAVVDAGVSSGCGGSAGALRYCPDDAVSRADLAVLIARARLGRSDADALPAYDNSFEDVPVSDYAARAVSESVRRRIMSSCGPLQYCPTDPINRAAAAAALARARLGRTQADALPAYGDDFSDVVGTVPQSAAVRWMKESGATAGCGRTTFCPAAPLTRAQVAVFLTRIFGLRMLAA